MSKTKLEWFYSNPHLPENVSPDLDGPDPKSGYPGVKLATAGTWSFWSRMTTGYLWELVALSCFIDPMGLESTTISLAGKARDRSPAKAYQERLRLAKSHARDGLLRLCQKNIRADDLENEECSLSEYGLWAQKLRLSLPTELRWDNSIEGYVRFGKFVRDPVRGGSKWPWGHHDSVLLSAMAEAVARFWRTTTEGGTYDPADQETAPKNDDVSKWLQSRGVSSNLADAMTTIIRPDGMPLGRRKVTTRFSS